ncbi:sensor histidine kinase [Kushneria phyllosphaerae]|uniref:histidine kinase n=1 Tax=Kushneria phyllosphaerae TaxID=2100822 RepID=A0A2R8CIP2_9GAMM|nr:sensor histidine kinase [Kushneria phyllosphaerae]SPJ32756.1 Virulence sensor histidine kinase PhoQ [Kushneria phyllosphaerae]
MFLPDRRSLRLRLLGTLTIMAMTVVIVTWWLHGMLLDRLAREFLADRLQQEALYSVQHLQSSHGPESPDPRVMTGSVDIFHHFYLLDVNGQLKSSHPDRLPALTPLLKGPLEKAEERQWRDHRLLIWRTRFMLEGQPATLVIGEDFASIERGLARLHKWIAVISAAILAGLLLLNLVAVNRALLPFSRLARQLVELQQGKRSRLEIETVSELDAPIEQLNTFLDDQERRQQRSRESLANLSHAIRAPLTAVIQSLRSRRELDAERRTRLLERLHDIDEKLGAELRRSRIAGSRTGQQRTDMADINSLMEMFATLYPDIVFSLTGTGHTDYRLPMERQDGMEMLGIVLDNAGKWARQRVELTLCNHPPGLRLEDDGPGVPDELLNHLGQRGWRLDEQRHGHGLGLSILAQLMERYEGRVRYTRASLGGLRVDIEFTRV